MEATSEGGLHRSLLDRRKAWNRPTPPEYGLPTEIWRETVARRQRSAEVKQRIEQGDITEINDFITHNLNIRQFLQDIIEQTEDADLIRHLYKAILNVTVLDPTCGSGAFLFAALNILEPLYEGCLQRMELFAAEEPGKHKFFEEVLQESRAVHHPNLQYFIYKSIILNNLYGVDLMREAVEIAKLRLFLKLVATVDPNPRKPNYGLEPLPDIDFNIRAGNTLVEFATEQELLDTISQREGLFAADKLAQFKEQCQVVSQAFSRFKDAQLIEDAGSESFKATKQELIKRLDTLNNELSRYLASNYGISETNIPDPQKREEQYQHWLETHQPFHWFAEFYEIIAGHGGFDVIIGNPPYVEYSKVRKTYTVESYETEKCGNLYTFVIERSCKIIHNDGQLGLIVPMSLSCTHRMNELRKYLINNLSESWISHFSGDANPSKLFEGAKLRLDILIGKKGHNFQLYSSNYLKWFAIERPFLFETIEYSDIQPELFYLNLFPKLGTSIGKICFHKLLLKSPLGLSLCESGQTIYVHRVMTMYIKCFDFIPYFCNETDGVKKSEDYKPYQIGTGNEHHIGLSALNSSSFFFYFIVLGDCFHCGKEFVINFPIGMKSLKKRTAIELQEISQKLMVDLKEKAIRRRATSQKTGLIEYDEFWPSKSKPIIDGIDFVLAQHYDFTEEELDFIINYDIKYRMGKELNNGIKVEATLKVDSTNSRWSPPDRWPPTFYQRARWRPF